MTTDAILQDAAQRFAIDGPITFVRAAANMIYEFQRDGSPYILRLTPEAGRDLNMILGELEFIDYLTQHGARAVGVERSAAGQLVEPVGDGHTRYYAAVFEKVPGVHPMGEVMTDAVLIKIGQGLGMIHRLAMDFVPSSPSWRRPQWHRMDIFQLRPYIPAEQEHIRQKAKEVLAAMHDLPTDEEAYGLIHGDAEPFNMLLHADELVFIDFDDCCYHWFAFELAVALMMAAAVVEPVDKDAYARHAWELLYQHGYRQEHTLSVFWLAQIPLFLRLRVLEDYAFCYLSRDQDNLEGWQADEARYLRHLIETDTPALNFSMS